MTDALHLTPREVAQVEAALDEPTRPPEPTPEQLERLSRTPARPWNPPSPPQSRLERDLSDFHVDRVSEHPSPEIVALAARTVRDAAARAVERIEDDDRG